MRFPAIVLTHLALAGICLLFAFLAFTGEQPTVFKDAYGNVTAVRDLGVWLKFLGSTAVALGIALVVNGVRLIVRRVVSPQTPAPTSNTRRRGSIVWSILNLILIIVAVWIGYSEADKSRLQTANHPMMLCVAATVAMMLLAIGAPYFARGGGLQSPSFDRCPVSWWTDPLQSLFISTLVCLGLFTGSILWALGRNHSEIWVVALFGNMFLGLLVGQAITYRLHAKWIRGRKGAD
jgi:uncharacterized membrane protein